MDTDYNVFTVGVSEGVGVRGGECQGDGSLVSRQENHPPDINT